MCERSERALEKFHISSILRSFIVLFSSNDFAQIKFSERASASRIVIFLEFDSISLYITQISLNSLNFWIISFSFLKCPWNFLNFWNSLKNSLRRSKFLRIRPKKEISLKVEALCLPSFWLAHLFGTRLLCTKSYFRLKWRRSDFKIRHSE